MDNTQIIQDSTQDFIASFVVDTILDSNVFAAMMFSNSRPWVGEKRKHAIKYQKSTQGKSFSGLEAFTIAEEQNTVSLEYEPKFYAQPITLSLTDVTINNVSESQMWDIVAFKVQSAAQDMADSVGTIFFGNGTGNGGKDFLGLAAIVDDGSNVATIGGLSRATYTTLQSTVTASGGTLSLAKMRTLWDDISSGSVEPTIAITTPAVFSLYDQLLEAKERVNRVTFTKNLRTGAGFTGLDFRGISVVKDEKCTSGVMFFLNEKFLFWEAYDQIGSDSVGGLETRPVMYKSPVIEGNDYTASKMRGFAQTEFVRAQNGLGVTSYIVAGGNLTTNNPKRFGKLTGITSV